MDERAKDGGGRPQDAFAVWLGATKWLRGLVAALLLCPPLVGLAVLIAVFVGFAPDQVLDSGAAISTALIVGALLILVPPMLYMWEPSDYGDYRIDLKRDVEGRKGKEQPPADEQEKPVPTGSSPN